MLEQLDCDVGRGYYFAHPLDARAASALLLADRGEIFAPPHIDAS